VSGVTSATLRYRVDVDGVNPLASYQNETYAGGTEVGPWQTVGMTQRAFPAGNVHNDPTIDFSVMPSVIADQYWAHLTGLADVLVDYYVEAVDGNGNVRRSPIQHVYVGTGGSSGDGPATWTPQDPVAGGSLTIRYDVVAGALPDTTNPVRIHIGHSGWTGIISPDPLMTFNGQFGLWEYTYAVPSFATTVDFVFTNGHGGWDNNGGGDWHVAVTGAEPPPHVIDGVLDAGLSPVASCAGLDLHADYDGRYLYVAAPPVGATAGLDHFVFVKLPGSPGGVRSAPWAKAGTASRWTLMLGNEDGNDWRGWFDGNETQVSAGIQNAGSGMLEALIDVTAWESPAPDSVLVWLAGYTSPDGGSLSFLAPCGNGNGNIEPGEWVQVGRPGTVAVGPPGPVARTPLGLRLLSPNPVRGRLAAAVDSPEAQRVRVELWDVAGRRVATVYDGWVRGSAAVSIDPRSLGDGFYLLSAHGASGSVTRKLTLLAR
jgi:hypothetical protein